jgi:hypothetical protein
MVVMAVIEFEKDWGIEVYDVGNSVYYGTRHKHGDVWLMATCGAKGTKRRCSCGAVASDELVAWLEVCRWKR